MSAIDRWLRDHVAPGPPERWLRWPVGAGRLILADSGLRLVVPRSTERRYSNAQIDDYAGMPRDRYPWRSPLRLTVRARFSESLRGTAGFGFWNHPFAPHTGIGALPEAIWFFRSSPPNDLPIALDVPGHGWKAATIDATHARARRWIPLAPAVILLNQRPAWRRRVWPLVQRDLGIAEAIIGESPVEWHTCVLEWRRDGARWLVNDRVVLESSRSPRGPLGFVAWIDNQYAVARPTGRLGWGPLDVIEPQWIDLVELRIEPL
jgi:hypothetical protein